MAILQPIVNLAELLARLGITDVVVSPGSRSAPLTLAVARHPRLRVRVMADERSAGFVALGMAQQSRQPVALICTSGSAVYNLAPAVVEAYFQQVPLLLLTADRPPEWLHQQDGQTIDQSGIFGPHVKRSYTLPADYTHLDARWFIERSVNEAVHLARLEPAGPVHINVPLREPFYPTPDEALAFDPVRTIDVLTAQPTLSAATWHRLLDAWEQHDRILIAVGQLPHNPALLELLRKLSTEWGIPVLGEITSNLPADGTFITLSDTILATSSGTDRNQLASLRPDLLLTMGGSFLGRNLKTFFRNSPPRQHWHLQPTTDRITDALQSLTTLIPAEPLAFLQKLFDDLDYQRFRQGDDEPDTYPFLDAWQTAQHRAGRLVQQTLATPDTPLTDWAATQQVLDHLPDPSDLHLANSMPIRYANLCGIGSHRSVGVFANRGVSGIDGCLSTAVGSALSSVALLTDRIVTLLIGDVAFFYDRNALWSAPVPPNLRIVLFNNDGGHIFRMIDGPRQQPELEPFFETPHGYTARRTAADAQLHYVTASTVTELTTLLPDFFQPADRAKLLEITTDKRQNQAQFENYKRQASEETNN